MPAPAIARATSIPPWIALSDPDVRTYVRAVEAADGATLELPVRKALHEFITGCKADGIWSAIKASCILAGARTLTGALVPLAGAAPTNFNFVSGDYNRKTGLVGDGSTKYLNSNRDNSADPQNSNHNSAWISSLGDINGKALIGVLSDTGNYNLVLSQGLPGWLFLRNRTSGGIGGIGVGPLIASSALVGVNRADSSNVTLRAGSSSVVFPLTSALTTSSSVVIYRRGGGAYADARIAFYSIGESLDLTLLDARVTQLITTFAAVIP